MRKIIFTSMILFNNLCFCCPHTEAIHTFLREKIDKMMEYQNVNHLSKEDVIKLNTYLEVLDYVAAID